ncbi:MAG: hypothetical protein DRJ10_17095 [Bacteroidetes bacterium]|nr:MAG: hypothetical protein DRJ10_17095 [Bacteroidota bacterium]
MLKNKLKISVLIFMINILGNSVLAQTIESSKITNQISLNESDIELFKEKSQQKIDEFTDYIVIIGDKAQPASKRNLAEKEALKLFFKGAIMETSSIRSDGTTKKKQRPMAEYLYRLKTLPYLKVVIKFYDICYVTEFTRGEDGNYYATATIFQEFTGFNGDNIAYHDITKKEISIIINLVEDEFFNEKRWKLFLGDVKASETKMK